MTEQSLIGLIILVGIVIILLIILLIRSSQTPFVQFESKFVNLEKNLNVTNGLSMGKLPRTEKNHLLTPDKSAKSLTSPFIPLTNPY